VVDRIIIERLTTVQTDVLTYLIECHKRAESWAKTQPSYGISLPPLHIAHTDMLLQLDSAPRHAGPC
jgi:hypothetical protein